MRITNGTLNEKYITKKWTKKKWMNNSPRWFNLQLIEYLIKSSIESITFYNFYWFWLFTPYLKHPPSINTFDDLFHSAYPTYIYLTISRYLTFFVYQISFTFFLLSYPDLPSFIWTHIHVLDLYISLILSPHPFTPFPLSMFSLSIPSSFHQHEYEKLTPNLAISGRYIRSKFTLAPVLTRKSCNRPSQSTLKRRSLSDVENFKTLENVSDTSSRLPRPLPQISSSRYRTSPLLTLMPLMLVIELIPGERSSGTPNPGLPESRGSIGSRDTLGSTKGGLVSSWSIFLYLSPRYNSNPTVKLLLYEYKLKS